MFRKAYYYPFFAKEFYLFVGDKGALLCDMADEASMILEAKGGLRPYSYECQPGGIGMVVMVVTALGRKPKHTENRIAVFLTANRIATRKRGKTRRRSRA